MKDRVNKKYLQNFTTASNKILQDCRLSYEAIGIFIYLWSMPDDWQVIVKQVMKHNNSSEYSVRKALHELRDFGYMKWIRTQGYFIYDMCEDGSFHCSDIQHNEFHYSDIQHNDIYIQKNNINKTITETNTASGFSNKKEIPVVKESLTTQSEVAGKSKKITDFTKRNGVNTGNEYTPEFETFWQRYKNLCENNIKIKKNTANAGSKQDAFLQWNKVLKVVLPNKILEIFDIYAQYNLEQFEPPKHACRWLSKAIDWQDCENQIACFRKELPLLKQAKQPKTEAQKFNTNTEQRKAVSQLTQEQQNAIDVMERKRFANEKTMNEKEKSELEYLKPLLIHSLPSGVTAMINKLVLKIEGNKYIFLMTHEAFLRYEVRFKNKVILERPNKEVELKLIN